jgi:hypothetical protein
MIPLPAAWKIAGVVAVVSLGATAWHQRDKRLRAEGAAELAASIAQARIDSVLVDAERRIHAADTLHAAELLAADSARAQAERRAEAARVRRPEIVERIVHAADTTAIRAAVEELEQAHEAQVTSLRDALAAADQATEAWRARYVAEHEVRVDLEGALADVAQRPTQAAQRGFLERWGERALYVGVGAGIGYVATR